MRQENKVSLGFEDGARLEDRLFLLPNGAILGDIDGVMARRVNKSQQTLLTRRTRIPGGNF